ncbi:serine hydrolase domain-containing protein [Micromonospora sp. CPCC 206061]|uniref:serine hydrolase domain-containing protein n=1 Tax=Micromonospora sp. CPCC 206061 TaxID=3122410 RepID=UPI002FEF2473
MLPTATPEEHGIPSSAVMAFLDAVEERVDALHSVVVVRHGHTLARGWWAPYQSDHPHALLSVSKSFTSTAVGLAVEEGLLSVDDLVAPLFPDSVPTRVDDHLAALRVRHLLTMTAGHAADTTDIVWADSDDDWARAFLAQPFVHEPGSTFVYDTPATYMLSAIVQRLTGQTVVEYLRPRLFEPLGIAEPIWETCPRGVTVGGWGLRLRTDEVARFGELYLRDGVWQGRQLVPASWVRAATASQVPTGALDDVDWQQGYGYQFWRSRHGYRADGAFGQFCLVLPEQDAVVAITSGTPHTPAVLDLVWKHLLPAMGDGPLSLDDGAVKALTDRLDGLRLPTVSGRAYTPLAAEVSGRLYHVDGGSGSITLHAEPGGAARLVLKDERSAHDLPIGYGEWRPGKATIAAGQTVAVSTSGAWTADDTYVAQAYATEMPYRRTLTYTFAGDRLTVEHRENVSFGPTEHPPVVATWRP